MVLFHELNNVIRTSLARVQSWLSPAKPKVLLLGGPTAVGKTSLSLHLAKRLGGEIISADSVQVYKGMDIGTDKVSPEVRSAVPHHLVDVRDFRTWLGYNAGTFSMEAEAIIWDILANDKFPIVVGGTAFYMEMLLRGNVETPASTPEALRQVNVEIKKRGSWENNLKALSEIDPTYARSLTVNNWRQLQRAFCIYHMSGRSVSSFRHKYAKVGPPFDYRCVCLTMTKEKLFDMIETRCEEIVMAGLVEETHNLLQNGLDPESTVGKSIGYRQAIDYLSSCWSSQEPSKRPVDEQVNDFLDFLIKYKFACRQYAGKQMRHFSRLKEFQWFLVDDLSHAEMAELVLSRLEPSRPLPVYNSPEVIQKLEFKTGDRDRINALSARPMLSPIFSDRDAVLNKLKAIAATVGSLL